MLIALPFTADTRSIAQDVSEPTAEDVTFIAWHPQPFLDGIRETVACKSEVLKHGVSFEISPFFATRQLMRYQ